MHYSSETNPVDKEGTDEEGLVPTFHEMHSLRRLPAPVPWRAYGVAMCELAERFSYYGVTNAFTNFIQQPRPPARFGGYTGANRSSGGVSGALNKGQQAAFGITTFNSFWVYCTPLLGAYLADSYWGRYNTIMIALVIATVGHIILIVSGVPTVMNNIQGAYACLIVAIVVMGLGTGFFKSNISPLIAEQVTAKKMQVSTLEKTGEKVIIDPNLTTTRLFMYFYLFINIGALAGQIGMAYSEKYVGFWLEYTLPTIIFLFCFPILIIWRKYYIKTPPAGSLLPSACRILWYCTKPCLSWNPYRTIKQMKADDFWDTACPSKIPPEQRPKWMTFDDTWVMETRRAYKACQVFCLLPIYQLAYNQMTSNLLSQAATMELHGTPNQIVQNMDSLAILILVPILDNLLYPLLRRRGWRISALQRIAVGFQVASWAMVYAAVTQHFVYKKSPCGYSAGECADSQGAHPAPINVWQQSGAYILIATSELLVNVPSYEYAFAKAPANMKSFVMAVQLFMNAISSALGEAFNPISQDPKLVENYAIVAGLCSGAGVLFWILFRGLDKQDENLNNLDRNAERETAAILAEQQQQRGGHEHHLTDALHLHQSHPASPPSRPLAAATPADEKEADAAEVQK